MAQRKQVTILYSYDEGWIGGTYYIQSLIQSLSLLPDAQQPDLIILCPSDVEFKQIENTGYKHLKKWENNRCNFEGNLTILDRVINKFSRLLFNKNSIQKPAVLNYPEPIDIIFPIPFEFRKFKEPKINLFWIPDFQEVHFPEFFDKKQLSIRKELSQYIAGTAAPIVFSSKDAQQDFIKLYPSNQCKKYVVPFAVTHPDYSDLNISEVLKQHQVSKPYFFAPNQFWSHKNHITLIKAAQQLVSENKALDFQIVFSGKEDDFRNPDYTPFLKKFVEDHHLSNHIRFLGFIDRKEQLVIMNEALAVVQPSLSEGWSTVIEDAKCMNQRIIASDLSVHLEQLETYDAKVFFKRRDVSDLASKLSLLLTQPFKKATADYSKNRLYFAHQFIRAVEELAG